MFYVTPTKLCLATAGLERALVTARLSMQAARDYGALPDAEAVRMARSGEGAGRMPLSAEILERLLPKDETPKASSDGAGRAFVHS